MNAKSGVRGSSCKRSGTCADGGAPPTIAAAPGKMPSAQSSIASLPRANN